MQYSTDKQYKTESSFMMNARQLYVCLKIRGIDRRKIDVTEMLNI